jgi:hypothetical protein
MVSLVISTITLLLIVFYQDVKYRGVTWFLFPLLAISLFLLANRFKDLALIFEHTLVNLSILFVQLVLVFTNLIIKHKRFIKNLEDYFGLGDLLYLLVICVYLSPINFFFYYIISLILCLMITYLFVAIKKDNRWIKIPLAGLQSLLLAILIIIDLSVENVSLIYDDHLIYYINY